MEETKKVSKKYHSVIDMVRDISQDEEFVADLERTIVDSEISRFLFTRRIAASVTKKALAKKMNCSPSCVSKIENGLDDDLRLGDLTAYLEALGYRWKLTFTKDDEETEFNAAS